MPLLNFFDIADYSVDKIQTALLCKALDNGAHSSLLSFLSYHCFSHTTSAFFQFLKIPKLSLTSRSQLKWFILRKFFPIWSFYTYLPLFVCLLNCFIIF